MPELTIAAETRTEFGKGAARRVRRADKVPAVVYGHGADPRHVSLPGHDLMLALKTSNVLLQLDLDGEQVLVLPKSVTRHPIKGHLVHVDLVLVRRGEKVTVEVPVQVTGDVTPGGIVDQQLVTLSVLAEATSIPPSFEVDVTGLGIGSQVHAKDVALPDGVELAADSDALVINVLAQPTAEQVDAELAEAEAEAGIEHDAPQAETADSEASGGDAEGDGAS